MTDLPAFFTDALTQIERGVVALIGGANLQVRTMPLPRSLAGRLRGQMRALEKMLRRVVMLMALAVLPDLGQPAPCARVKHKTGTKHAENVQRFSMLPVPLALTGAHGFPDLPRRRGPVPVRKLFRRLAVLQSVLAAPGPHARRLARRLQRLMASGEARPVVLGAARPRRMGRDLVMIDDVLALHLRTALAVWPDTS